MQFLYSGFNCPTTFKMTKKGLINIFLIISFFKVNNDFLYSVFLNWLKVEGLLWSKQQQWYQRSRNEYNNGYKNSYKNVDKNVTKDLQQWLEQRRCLQQLSNGQWNA